MAKAAAHRRRQFVQQMGVGQGDDDDVDLVVLLEPSGPPLAVVQAEAMGAEGGLQAGQHPGQGMGTLAPGVGAHGAVDGLVIAAILVAAEIMRDHHKNLHGGDGAQERLLRQWRGWGRLAIFHGG